MSITQSVDLPPMQANGRVAQATELTGVNPGDQLVYTIVVADAGPDAAEGVAFTNKLPASTTLVDSVLPDGSTCADPVDGEISCQVGTMAASTSAEFVFTALVDEATPFGTVLSSTAEVTSTTGDPNILNNTAATTATLRDRVSDLRVTKIALDEDGMVSAGEQVTYRITITNGGLDSEPTVTVTDVLPEGVTPSGTLPEGCDYDAPTVTCEVGPLDSDQDVVLEIAVTVAPQIVSAELTNNVTVAGTADPDMTNNSDSAKITVVPLEQFVLSGNDAPRLSPAPGELVAGIELPRTGSRPVKGQVVAALALIAAGLPVFVAARRRRPSASRV